MAANAQSHVYKTVIVTEKQSGDPIPFATLRTAHSSEIFETDFNGKVLMPLSESSNDTLFCLFVGYLTAAVPLDSQKIIPTYKLP